MFLFMLQYQFTIRVLWLVLSIFISFMVKTFTLSCGPVVQTSTPSFTVIVLVKRREIYPHIYIYISPAKKLVPLHSGLGKSFCRQAINEI